MAIKPAIFEIEPFDAYAGTTINFSYSHTIGNLAKLELRIYNSSNLKIVGSIPAYTNTSQIAIPRAWNPINTTGEVWKNGMGYCAEIAAYIYTDNSHTEIALSSISDKAYFRTYTPPMFGFISGITSGMVLNKNSLTVKLSYTQAEGEELYSYCYQLYENSDIIYRASETFYTSYINKGNGEEQLVNKIMTYSFKGLKNGEYKLRAMGQTKNGISLDTGLIPFTVAHESDIASSVLQLRSDENATVYGNTNVRPIDPDELMSDGYELAYSCVNLTQKYLTYEMNYLVQNDFTLTLKMHDVIEEGLIYYGKNEEEISTILITVYTYDNGMSRFHLKVGNDIWSRNYYTEEFDRSRYPLITLHVRRKNNLYHMEMICKYSQTDVI